MAIDCSSLYVFVFLRFGSELHRAVPANDESTPNAYATSEEVAGIVALGGLTARLHTPDRPARLVGVFFSFVAA